MRVVTKTENDYLTVKLSGELDECSAEYVRACIDNAVNSGTFHGMILDMAGVRFMDSTGIGVLLGRYNVLKRKGIPLYIKNCTNHVDRILSMSGIYRIIKKIS